MGSTLETAPEPLSPSRPTLCLPALPPPTCHICQRSAGDMGLGQRHPSARLPHACPHPPVCLLSPWHLDSGSHWACAGLSRFLKSTRQVSPSPEPQLPCCCLCSRCFLHRSPTGPEASPDHPAPEGVYWCAQSWSPSHAVGLPVNSLFPPDGELHHETLRPRTVLCATKGLVLRATTPRCAYSSSTTPTALCLSNSQGRHLMLWRARHRTVPQRSGHGKHAGFCSLQDRQLHSSTAG